MSPKKLTKGDEDNIFYPSGGKSNPTPGSSEQQPSPGPPLSSPLKSRNSSKMPGSPPRRSSKASAGRKGSALSSPKSARSDYAGSEHDSAFDYGDEGKALEFADSGFQPGDPAQPVPPEPDESQSSNPTTKNNDQSQAPAASKNTAAAGAPGDPGGNGSDSDGDDKKKSLPKDAGGSPAPRKKKKNETEDEVAPLSLSEKTKGKGKEVEPPQPSRPPARSSGATGTPRSSQASTWPRLFQQPPPRTGHDRIFHPPVHPPGPLGPPVSGRQPPSRGHVFVSGGQPPLLSSHPDPLEEIARQELAREEQAAARGHTVNVIQARRQQEIQEHRLGIQRRLEEARSLPHSVLQWRELASDEAHKDEDCVTVGNAAIDGALAIGTSQTARIVDEIAKRQRVEKENKKLKEEAQGKGSLATASTSSLSDDCKRQLDKKDKEIQDLTSKIGNRQNTIDQHTDTINTQKATIRSLKDALQQDQTIERQKIEKADLERQLEKLKQDIKALNETNAHKTPSNAISPDEALDVLSAAIDEYSEWKKKVKGLEEELQNEKIRRDQRVGDSALKIQDLTDQIGLLKASNGRLKKEIADKQSQFSAQRKKCSKEVRNLRDKNIGLQASVDRLTQTVEDKVREINRMKRVVNSELVKSLQITKGWDNHASDWKPVETRTGADDHDPDDPDEIIISAMFMEVEIARIQIALFNLIQQRAVHGTQDFDSENVTEIAQEVVESAIEYGDLVRLAQAYLWRAIVMWFADDLQAAITTFTQADLIGDLPEQERRFIGSWIDQAKTGGPDERAVAYGGLDTEDLAEVKDQMNQDKTKFDEEKKRLQEKTEEYINKITEKLNRGTRKAQRSVMRAQKKEKDAKNKLHDAEDQIENYKALGIIPEEVHRNSSNEYVLELSGDREETREVVKNAQQAYIRDQEFYSGTIDPREILAVSGRALVRWTKFKKIWRKVARASSYDETPPQSQFKFIETAMRTERALNRVNGDSTQLGIHWQRDRSWWEYQSQHLANNPELGAVVQQVEMEMHDTFPEPAEAEKSGGSSEVGDTKGREQGRRTAA